jgi:hypothetical protein
MVHLLVGWARTSTLRMEAVYFFEMAVNFYRTSDATSQKIDAYSLLVTFQTHVITEEQATLI